MNSARELLDLQEPPRIEDADPRVQEALELARRVVIRLGAAGIGPLPDGTEPSTPRQKVVDVLAAAFYDVEGAYDAGVLSPTDDEVTIDLRELRS